jgi:uncharacterized protein (DUF1810 family)
MSDPFDLARFVSAQAPVIKSALAELAAGRKASHWMWFVFPQIAGLGASPTARRYAIASLDEARAYLAHPVLGPRLERCVEALLGHGGLSARQIMGSPDDMKLRSSLTLFARAGPGRPLFAEGLAKYFEGEPDPLTLARLDAADRGGPAIAMHPLGPPSR